MARRMNSNIALETPLTEVGHRYREQHSVNYAIPIRLPSGNYVEVMSKQKFTEEDLLDLIEYMQVVLDEDQVFKITQH